METDKGSLPSVLTDNGASVSSGRTVNRVSQIISGKRAVTGGTALRFGHWFGVELEFWLNLQYQFDLVRANQHSGKAIQVLPTSPGSPLVDYLPQYARNAESRNGGETAADAETRPQIPPVHRFRSGEKLL